MATSFSSATPARSLCQPISSHSPKSLLSIRDTYGRVSSSKSCLPISKNVSSWSSSSNYVGLQVGASNFSEKPIVGKQLAYNRTGVWKCATIEEIEAEKSMIENDAKKRMDKTIESVRENFDSIRTGRASPNMLDRVEVEYYGTPVNLKSIAQISTPDASSLLIQPYDKSSLKSIEKAIVSSDVNLNPNNDGEVIRLSIPQLTSDRRKDLAKVVAKQAEEGKVAIRNIRRDALKSYEKLEKEKKLSEDIVKDLSGDLQKVTDEYMKKVESLLKQKEKELLKV